MFDIGTASFAFMAAVFWFLSAYGTAMRTYWGSTPENDPYFQALKFSAAMNTLASGFSGATAHCMGLKLFIRG